MNVMPTKVKYKRKRNDSKWQSFCAYTKTFYINYLATPTADGKGEEGTLSPFDLAVEYEEADNGAGPWGTGTGKPTFKSPWCGVKL